MCRLLLSTSTPPVAYQHPFSSCGIPGCRREAVIYRARPALADSEACSRPPSRQLKRRVSFSESNQEEQAVAASRRSGSAGSRKRVYKTGVRLMTKSNEEKKIIPSASVAYYNVVQSDQAGNVYNMLVRF